MRPNTLTAKFRSARLEAEIGVVLILEDRYVRRRDCISGIAGSAAWPLVARAQQTGKIVKVGYLGPSSLALEHVQVDALKQRLYELGHVEGKDIAFVFRWAEGHDGRFSALATELVGLKPDVIVTTGTPGTLAAELPARSLSSLRRVPIRSAPASSLLISGQAAT